VKGIEGVEGEGNTCCESSNSAIGTWRESTISNRSRLTNRYYSSSVTIPVRFRSIINDFESVQLVNNVGGCRIGKERKIRETSKATSSKRNKTGNRSKGDQSINQVRRGCGRGR